MNDRFVNKTKEYVETIDDIQFTLKPLHWGDRGKLASIMRQLYKPLFKLNDIVSNDKLNDKQKADAIKKANTDDDSFDYLNDEQIKITDGLLRKYIVKIEGVDIPLKDIQYKEADVLAIMDALLRISNMKEEEVKNLEDSSSSK